MVEAEVIPASELNLPRGVKAAQRQSILGGRREKLLGVFLLCGLKD